MKSITKEQLRLLESVIDYMRTNERDHLEETLCEYTDEDTSRLVDDDLYNLCVELNNDFINSHIWLKIHKLSEILN